MLSNHPGMGPPAGTRLEAEALGAMIDALERLGQLDRARAVMTGYFVTADQIEAVADRVARLKGRREDLVVLVDPVIGDDADGLYVDERVAVAMRERLVPIASIVTPNCFELAVAPAGRQRVGSGGGGAGLGSAGGGRDLGRGGGRSTSDAGDHARRRCPIDEPAAGGGAAWHGRSAGRSLSRLPAFRRRCRHQPRRGNDNAPEGDREERRPGSLELEAAC